MASLALVAALLAALALCATAAPELRGRELLGDKPSVSISVTKGDAGAAAAAAKPADAAPAGKPGLVIPEQKFSYSWSTNDQLKAKTWTWDATTGWVASSKKMSGRKMLGDKPSLSITVTKGDAGAAAAAAAPAADAKPADAKPAAAPSFSSVSSWSTNDKLKAKTWTWDATTGWVASSKKMSGRKMLGDKPSVSVSVTKGDAGAAAAAKPADAAPADAKPAAKPGLNIPEQKISYSSSSNDKLKARTWTWDATTGWVTTEKKMSGRKL
ncbi:hypothetical protein HT031_003318 [Scenedesmus sp. PABB004]|nr:hypothetical protein HT031_003318 [Scenedesmus sp. PABB004]